MAIDPVAVAEAALGRDVATATVISRTPINYDPYLPGRTVERIAGMADGDDGDRFAWSAVVKRTSGVDLRAARRELAAYRDGVADAGPRTGLRAPALLGWDAGPHHVELWLEALQDDHGGLWPTARFGAAARHIAAWDAQSNATSLPAGFDSEDAWAERHGQPHRVGEAIAELDELRRTSGSSEIAAVLHDPGLRRVHELIASTPARIDRLATFDQVPLHHDLVRSNLFALGGTSTAAIDWENVGRGPFGVDLAPLVVGSVRRGEASAEQLSAIERAVLADYVAGLRHARINREADVRAAYRLAVGLRWHVVLGTIGAWLDPTVLGMRGSRRDESRAEGLRHLVAVSRHILAATESPEG